MLVAPKLAAVMLTRMECSFQGAGLQCCMQLRLFQLLWTLPLVTAGSGLRSVQTCRQPLSCPHSPNPIAEPWGPLNSCYQLKPVADGVAVRTAGAMGRLAC